MTVIGGKLPLPADSTVSTRWPNSEPVLMCAVLADPSWTCPLTVNVTRTSPRCSDMPDTLPTLIPDTVTSLPSARPPASENSAWWRIVVARCTSWSGASPTAMTSTTSTRPMNPARMRAAPRYLFIGILGFRTPSGDLVGDAYFHRPVLQIGDTQRQSAQVVGEPGAVGTESPQFAVIVRQLLQRNVDEVLVLVQQRGQPIQLVDGARQRRAGSAEQIRDRGGSIVQGGDGGADGVAVLRQSADQPLEAVNSAGELGALLVDGAHHGVEVVDQLLHRLVVVGQRVGKRRRLRQQRLQGSALALENLNERCAERIDVLRIEALGNRFQSTEQQIDVERKCGPVDWNLRPDRQHLGGSGTVDELEIAITDQVEVPNDGPGAGGEHHAAVGVEFHQNLLVRTQRDAVDRAHPDTGDPDCLPLFQSRHIGEERRIPCRRTGLVLPENEKQGHGEQRHHQGEGPELDDHRA